MVFSSLPAYHHHDPSNWQQQPNHPITPVSTATTTPGAAASVVTSQQLLSQPLPPPPPPPSQPHGSGGAGSIRPGSMADRARMANIPMPEAALKCPRCESTNTKFCYFNNYNLTQPRHFCKTCRRYWTRGGALRNVPVGGGCRRNKRSKGSSSSSGGGGGSSSKSSAATASGSSSAIPSNNSGASSAADILGLTQQLPAALRFMTPLHHHQLAGTDFAGDIGLNYGLNYGAADLNFHLGGASSLLSGVSGGVEQWRMPPPPPQFPFLPAGLDPNSGSAEAGFFEGEMASGFSVRAKQPPPSSSIIHQMASVKVEDDNNSNNNNNNNNQGEMNFSRQLLGMNPPYHHDNQYWTDLSGNFSSSSTTGNNNPL